MSKDVLPVGNIEIEKNTFHHNKTPILLKHVNIEQVLVSSKISFGEKDYKYLIGHYIWCFLKQALIKSYDGQTKWVYLLLNIMIY